MKKKKSTTQNEPKKTNQNKKTVDYQGFLANLPCAHSTFYTTSFSFSSSCCCCYRCPEPPGTAGEIDVGRAHGRAGPGTTGGVNYQKKYLTSCRRREEKGEKCSGGRDEGEVR